jgi:hypothetical protein
VRRYGGAEVRRCGGAEVRRCGGAEVRRWRAATGLGFDGGVAHAKIVALKPCSALRRIGAPTSAYTASCVTSSPKTRSKLNLVSDLPGESVSEVAPQRMLGDCELTAGSGRTRTATTTLDTPPPAALSLLAFPSEAGVLPSELLLRLMPSGVPARPSTTAGDVGRPSTGRPVAGGVPLRPAEEARRSGSRVTPAAEAGRRGGCIWVRRRPASTRCPNQFHLAAEAIGSERRDGRAHNC